MFPSLIAQDGSFYGNPWVEGEYHAIVSIAYSLGWIAINFSTMDTYKIDFVSIAYSLGWISTDDIEYELKDTDMSSFHRLQLRMDH